ncbi:hypothetical protein CNMCM8812_007477 [Aspergillus fumigatus]|nr:hypothetical protein CNMCM8714_004034 [Aspergillus fumigatus]KAF4273514.1 hypothetical protein CNMCM8812_007477 [Aspergillus fumigatus]KAF4288523.1 hypothetical protein CNMCM8689_004674 [Aspergillus fumigatus]KAJ8153752.1 hypothetical protein LV165_006403 [Aspergillus fumigatus]KAJ8158128.1 hypothetical protein LV155_005080 [Aspergillus fumigatus]
MAEPPAKRAKRVDSSTIRTIGGVRGPVMIEDIVPGQEIELKGVEKGAGLAIGVTGTGTAIAIGQIGIETVGEQETEIQARPEKDIMTDEDIETDTAPAPAHLFGMGIGTGLELHHLEGRREIAETIAKTTDEMELDPAVPIEEDEMEALMRKTVGFTRFRSTKNTKVPGNNIYGVRKEKKTVYRQYMNRVGGFNRPLSP